MFGKQLTRCLGSSQRDVWEAVGEDVDVEERRRVSGDVEGKLRQIQVLKIWKRMRTMTKQIYETWTKLEKTRLIGQ